MKRSILFRFLLPILILPVVLPAAEQPQLAKELQPFVDRHALAGAVALVADQSGVLSTDAVGFADVGAGKAMAADALFWIASQSKPMTATAVMMLVDEGKIALDDPVEKYLPEFKTQVVVAEDASNKKSAPHAPAHPFTIREALSHMTGLPFKSAAEAPTLDGLPLADAVRSYAATPLQWEPGSAYQYSNAGVNTAARVLEVVAGMPYEQFMQKRLFDPLGMVDTTFWPTAAQVARLAKSYKPNDQKNGLVEIQIGQLRYPLDDRAHRFPMPAGGLFSTAKDVFRFCRMLLNGGELDGKRYLSAAALRELSRRQTPESVKNSYGLGFAVSGDSFGHGGAEATNMDIRPKDGLVLVWMVQHAGFPGDGKEAQNVFRKWALERYAKH
jgi:CubicO group peptidase (beta-lactamase class C family)